MKHRKKGAPLSRRELLGGLGAAGTWIALRRPAAGRPDGSEGAPRIGIALGSGGAKGLAHILMLDVLDELGLRPHRIAGASIGALVGALYASGLSAREIRALVTDLALLPQVDHGDTGVFRDFLRLVQLIDPDLGDGGLIRGHKFLNYLVRQARAGTFEELEIPLSVVAADFWQRSEVVLDRGDLRPALEASMALPGLMVPVALGERILVDGGTVNPVPYDLLLDDCDLVIAVDVLGERSLPDPLQPSYVTTIFNTFQIMQRAILLAKFKHRRPDIYVQPDLVDIQALDFGRAETIFRQAEPAREVLRTRLRELMAGS